MFLVASQVLDVFEAACSAASLINLREAFLIVGVSLTNFFAALKAVSTAPSLLAKDFISLAPSSPVSVAAAFNTSVSGFNFLSDFAIPSKFLTKAETSSPAF